MKRRHVRVGALASIGFLGLYAEGCGARDSDSVTLSSALGSSSVVISQVYGGGGNSGAPYNGDFIELFNRSSAPASLSGWSVQYASASG